MLEIKKVTDSSDLNECLAIRREVFIDEQGVDEELEIDEHDTLASGCVHFLGALDGLSILTFRFSKQDDGFHLQRFCVKEEYRRKGFGEQALCFLDRYCRENEITRYVLGAQCTAVGFYEKHGCRVTSGVFLDAGIDHVMMEKIL